MNFSFVFEGKIFDVSLYILPGDDPIIIFNADLNMLGFN